MVIEAGRVPHCGFLPLAAREHPCPCCTGLETQAQGREAAFGSACVVLTPLALCGAGLGYL